VADNCLVVGSIVRVEREATDATLIVRSRVESEVFGVVFDRHFVAVHRYLARRVGRNRADDLAAQTFVVAFARRGAFDQSVASARPWLLGIATNLMRNELRAEQRLLGALARLDSGSAGDLADEVERSLARASAVSEVAQVASALGELDRDQRDVLLLWAWGELSYEEIASALAIPIGTVRSRLSRARSALRRALADDPSEKPSTVSEERADDRRA
jgi:RNA polymerase sigma factor (sigma-70 family)